MKKQILIIAGLASVLTLAGCNGQPVQPSETHQVINQEVHSTVINPEKTAPAPVEKAPSQLIKISGIGYGTASTYEGYTEGQKRLMAIRSSKLDAYRSLAEQLFGIKIDSNTSVSTLMAKNDNFRARINAVVRGARVVSITPMPDDNYETVLEVYIDQNFFRNAFIYSDNSANCTSGNCQSKPVDLSQVCSSGMNCSSLNH